jgi:hypothetical protein
MFECGGTDGSSMRHFERAVQLQCSVDTDERDIDTQQLEGGIGEGPT